MRHAVLGVGGVGGILAAALARAGADVTLIMRPATLAGYPGKLTVQSAVLGDFEVPVPAATTLDVDVDVLWITTKATQLAAALSMAPPPRVEQGTVIPLLNGIDHLTLLRSRYAQVVAGAIRVESERVAVGQIRQRSPFLHVELAGAEPVAVELRAAGLDCLVRADEVSLLWEKLAFLAPLALATSALDAPLGAVRADPRFAQCRDEALAVARAEGADIDGPALRAAAGAAPDGMRSSMQKDVASGQAPELDAIAGPIIRGGITHHIPTPITEALSRLVLARIG
ncbi:MAG TPA: 2-dehydropantoate 2-reductase N-terminal domain-containing protein [Mycobacteriales bacterium]|nr:2-dehydropantoate 2-reductase N-terminal domain-containing protein [Mycobacteriales bacterium]